MNIYIAKDYENNPLAVVLAKNKELAEAVFMGMKTQHHATEEIDPSNDTLGINGVVTLFGNKEVEVGSGMGRRTITILKRGL